MKFFKTLLVLLPTFALAAAAFWFFTKSPNSNDASGDPAAAEGGRLLVLVVFDQMRGDSLERWAPAFGPDGFERMKRDGTWFSNCSVPYACSATAPGHASIVSGATPAVHGIIDNWWYDRSRGKLVMASSSDEPTSRVPGPSPTGFEMAPSRLLAPTLSDALKAGTNGKGRLVSASLKPRAAVLLGGKESTNVHCFDNGEFHTSSYYRGQLPGWVEKFNKDRIADRWSGQVWERLGSTADYNRLAGPDDQFGEYAPVITLPKPLAPVERGAAYYNDLEGSPFGNELLWEFAKAALAAEKLGRNGTTDVLALSFSANDTIGHAFGPDSHEVLDVTLRSDRLVAAMMTHLDETVGPGKYTLVITSDHGIAPLPEVALKQNPEAARILYSDLVNGLDEALDNAFGKPDGVPGRWVEGDFKYTKPWVYLNRRLIDSTGVPYETVESYAAKWLANRPDALTAFRRTNLAAGTCLPEEKPMFDLVRNAFQPERGGDIYIVQKPYLQLTGTTGRGVDHGTLHDYDRQVFVLAAGAKIPKLGKQAAPFNWLGLAAMMSGALGIEPPAKAAKFSGW